MKKSVIIGVLFLVIIIIGYVVYHFLNSGSSISINRAEKSVVTSTYKDTTFQAKNAGDTTSSIIATKSNGDTLWELDNIYTPNIQSTTVKDVTEGDLLGNKDNFAYIGKPALFVYYSDPSSFGTSGNISNNSNNITTTTTINNTPSVLILDIQNGKEISSTIPSTDTKGQETNSQTGTSEDTSSITDHCASQNAKKLIYRGDGYVMATDLSCLGR